MSERVTGSQPVLTVLHQRLPNPTNVKEAPRLALVVRLWMRLCDAGACVMQPIARTLARILVHASVPCQRASVQGLLLLCNTVP